MSQSHLPNQSHLFQSLWDKQGGICALCSEVMPQHRFDVVHSTIWKKKRPTFDHIRPSSKGGMDDASNLQLAHAICNKRKGNKW